MFRDILKEEYENRKSANGSYSMRAMARDLKVSPSFLVNVINGKRSLSENSAKKIVNSLSLSFVKKRQFLLSARLESCRKTEMRNSLKNELNELGSESHRFRKSHPEELKKMNSYLHFAILSALDLSEGPVSVSSLSRKFSETSVYVKQVLEDLVEFRYADRFSENFYQTRITSTETTSETPSTDIRKIHRSAIEKALESIEKNYTDRELSTTILSFASSDYQEAKDMINDFVYQFHNRFSSSGDKDSIRQLTLQFTRLDTPEQRGD